MPTIHAPWVFTVSQESYEVAEKYLNALKAGTQRPGKLLEEKRSQLSPVKNWIDMPVSAFLELLLSMKEPKAFAEQILQRSNHPDYNQLELKILSNIGVVSQAIVYNDGGHSNSFKELPKPTKCYMGFVSAPCLESGSPDLNAVCTDSKIDQAKYNKIMEERLLPVLFQMSEAAKARGKKIALTLPGLGCGLFAGTYGGTIRAHFLDALESLLNKYHKQLDGLHSVYVDTFENTGISERLNASTQSYSKPYGDINFTCVASKLAPENTKKQLVLPDGLGDHVELGTIVAADLLSWMGNDGWVNARSTDEGVKGMSSNIMAIIACYLDPAQFKMEDFMYNVQLGEVRHESFKWGKVAGDISKGTDRYAHQPIITINATAPEIKGECINRPGDKIMIGPEKEWPALERFAPLPSETAEEIERNLVACIKRLSSEFHQALGTWKSLDSTLSFGRTEDGSLAIKRTLGRNTCTYSLSGETISVAISPPDTRFEKEQMLEVLRKLLYENVTVRKMMKAPEKPDALENAICGDIEALNKLLTPKTGDWFPLGDDKESEFGKGKSTNKLTLTYAPEKDKKFFVMLQENNQLMVSEQISGKSFTVITDPHKRREILSTFGTQLAKSETLHPPAHVAPDRIFSHDSGPGDKNPQKPKNPKTQKPKPK